MPLAAGGPVRRGQEKKPRWACLPAGSFCDYLPKRPPAAGAARRVSCDLPRGVPMSPLPPSVLKSDEVSARLEPILARFEEAWLAGGRPDLGDFIPPDEPERASLILELAHVDLECRIKHGLEARVEAYVRRFPELANAPEGMLDLIEAEFHLRHRTDSGVSADEYIRRFPGLREPLARRLAAAESLPEAVRTRLDCPGCKHTIPLADGPRPQDFTCPACGLSFRGDPGHPRPGLRSDLTRLGQFLIEAVVGRGAFGTVYRARDEELDRVVAVKVPRVGPTSPAEEDRFFREARAAAQLSHP